LIDDLDGGAEGHGGAGGLAGVDDLGERQERLELLDAALVEALLLLGGVVLGVFAEVAMRPRLGDRRDDRRAVLGGAAAIFLAQRSQTGSRHRDLIHSRLQNTSKTCSVPSRSALGHCASQGKSYGQACPRDAHRSSRWLAPTGQRGYRPLCLGFQGISAVSGRTATQAASARSSAASTTGCSPAPTSLR